MKIIKAYMAIGVLSMYLTTGWLFSYFQGRYPGLAHKDRGPDLAVSVIVSTLGPPYGLSECP